MAHAVALAGTSDFCRGGGNPRVGCVLLDRHGVVVGTGLHRGAGSDHAEIVALREAGQAARGGTAVVTLEPCAHVGRMGPCAAALAEAGLDRVIFGQEDPDGRAAGGAAWLRSAGIAVAGPLHDDDVAGLNTDWTFARRVGRPAVRVKSAATLDGRIAAFDGSSRWITSRPARYDAHRWRDYSDAVLVGTGTVRADDPQLTVRLPAADRHAADQPLRAIFGHTPVPATAAICDQTAETVRLATRSAGQALAQLGRYGVSSVLIEGGPQTTAVFLRAGLVDAMICYIAPAVLGSGPAAVADMGVSTIDQARRGRITDITSVGDGPDRCLRVTTHFPAADSQPADKHFV